MNTHLHLTFAGHCDAAFTFYEAVFGTERVMTMRWSEAPKDIACPEGSEYLVMHTAIRLGGITLMGADALPGHGTPFGGFDVSVDDAEEAEVRRLFTALSEGGRVRMPLAPTFWSPLFGMCTDRFGVPWMVSVAGQEA